MSDPASAEGYGVEEIPYQKDRACGPPYNGLLLRPQNPAANYLTGKEIVNDSLLTNDVIEYVLNPNFLPSHADSPKRAYILLVDREEGETAWRAGAIEAIRTAYSQIWDDVTSRDYGMKYKQLPRWQKELVLKDYPMMVVTAGPWIIPPPPPPPPYQKN